MYLVLIFLPLFSFIITNLAGNWLGKKGAVLITCTSIAISCILSFIIFFEVAINQSPVLINVFSWFNIGILHVDWCFLFDTITVVILIVVNFISFLVHVYSVEYMSEDPHLTRFLSYLSLFTFFMLMLVTAGNFIQMFFGWEGVGLSSYLLINFWYTRLQANKAAIKAILVNRVGDFGLSLGIFTTFYLFKSLDFTVVFALANSINEINLEFLGYSFHGLSVISFFLFIGAIGKSAQLGLHTWLPDAMEGPTPVSALIHAATMVTAGVFVIVRCSPLFSLSPSIITLVTVIGGLTAFFSATVGLMQNDLKRVIAYSTCSQLGYMIFACGLSAYSVAMFHLMNHAFFKALLFLGAGSVIHALSDEQDMRRIGGFSKLLPLTYSLMLLGSLSLIGFPFLTGFYSKDLILEVALSTYTVSGRFVYCLGTISAFFTAFYSIRLLILTFVIRNNAFKSSTLKAHEPKLFMIVPLLLLSLGSTFVGYIFKDLFVGLGTSFWNESVFIIPTKEIFINAEFQPQLLKLFPVIFSTFGIISSFFLYMFMPKKIWIFENKIFLTIYKFLNRKWYFDLIYNSIIVKPVLNFGYKVTLSLLDRGFFEFIGPTGLAYFAEKLGKTISEIQSGYIYHYASYIVTGLTLLVIMFIITSNNPINIEKETWIIIVYLTIILSIITNNKIDYK